MLMCLCAYFYIMVSCVIFAVCSCLKDFCLCAWFSPFISVHFQLLACPIVVRFMCVLTPTLSSVLFFFFFLSGSCQTEMVISVFFYPIFLPHSIQTLWQIQSILQSHMLTSLALAKIAFLLCRSEGFCCDKSDSLTEQLSSLLTMTVIWLGDWLICGQLNGWLVFIVGDWLIHCLALLTE